MRISTAWILVSSPLIVCTEAYATHFSSRALRRTAAFASRSTPLSAHPAWAAVPRGGSLVSSLTSKARQVASASSSTLSNWKSSPSNLFNLTLGVLALVTVFAKVVQRAASETRGSDAIDDKPAEVKSLQRRFLAVFWLLRCSDWLQGPYFYDVYASKVINGAKASFALVSQLFLTGFASTALFGPSVGRAADQYGRKKATIAFSIIYAAGALSTKSPLLKVLLAGRVLSGIGTSLLFSAPESWLVAESQKIDSEGKYLGETFGLAYAGDSIVAILAGQLAAAAALSRGSTGPFELSTIFLLCGGLLTASLWGENKASRSDDENTTIGEAVNVIAKDPKILLVGAVQSLFEAAMYIFVLQWPPAMTGAIQKFFGASAKTPYGTIFSCFMACCLLGSTAFGQCSKWEIPTEKFTLSMLGLATTAMTVAAWTVQQSKLSLPLLIASFFMFEACVGMYFPSIGTLRSRFVPDSHRSVIMNLFGIPLNVLVVSVFLSIDKLGVGGALSVSATALGVATACMFGLRRMVSREQKVDFSI